MSSWLCYKHTVGNSFSYPPQTYQALRSSLIVPQLSWCLTSSLVLYLPGVSRHMLSLEWWNFYKMGKEANSDHGICLFHAELNSWNRFALLTIKKKKMFLVVPWSMMPFSNMNLPLGVFSQVCFLNHHQGSSCAVFSNYLIFLHHVNNHIDPSLYFISISVYEKIYWPGVEENELFTAFHHLLLWEYR